MVRYRMRSESDVEFSMLDLLFTAPTNTHKADHEVKKRPQRTIRRVVLHLLSFYVSPVLLLPGRTLALRFFRSQSGLMASISSTEEARRMLWKLSRERPCDKVQLETEPSGLRLRRWWGTMQGDDWV